MTDSTLGCFLMSNMVWCIHLRSYWLFILSVATGWQITNDNYDTIVNQMHYSVSHNSKISQMRIQLEVYDIVFFKNAFEKNLVFVSITWKADRIPIMENIECPTI